MNETHAASPRADRPLRSGPEPVRLAWAAHHGLVGLSLVNFVLRVLTIGVYHFWGKTEVRRRIWSAIRINGEPLAYTGTGLELFLGFLLVFAAVVLPVILLSFAAVLAFGPGSPWLIAYQLFVYAAFFFLFGVAIHRAQRYRLARTRWRGIRSGLEGSSWRYGWTHFWTGLLILLTLGWIVPWRSTRLQSLITNGMRFGDRPFRFSASSAVLYPRFAVLWIAGLCILLASFTMIGSATAFMLRAEDFHPDRPPDISRMTALLALIYATLLAGLLVYGVFSAWYRAGMLNHFAAHTAFEGATFKGSATAASLMWLTLSNYLLVLLTLGILAPLAQARSARYLIEHIALVGDVPLAEIAQREEDSLRRGEGLAQAFDIDAF
ncbi:MAG TPA: DUF898 family protein [Hyphomicrobiaceae bacterium]|nr:DUF898 family protein [Hyphomicrobiaceae bacterium]